jgi:hypothetical protein
MENYQEQTTRRARVSFATNIQHYAGTAIAVDLPENSNTLRRFFAKSKYRSITREVQHIN